MSFWALILSSENRQFLRKNENKHLSNVHALWAWITLCLSVLSGAWRYLRCWLATNNSAFLWYISDNSSNKNSTARNAPPLGLRAKSTASVPTCIISSRNHQSTPTFSYAYHKPSTTTFSNTTLPPSHPIATTHRKIFWHFRTTSLRTTPNHSNSEPLTLS